MKWRRAIDLCLLAALARLLSGGLAEARFTFSIAPIESNNLNCFTEPAKRGSFNGGAVAECCYRCVSLGSACAAVSYSALTASCTLLSVLNHTSDSDTASGYCTLVKSDAAVITNMVKTTAPGHTMIASMMTTNASTKGSLLQKSQSSTSNETNEAMDTIANLSFHSQLGASSSLRIAVATETNATTMTESAIVREAAQTVATEVVNASGQSLSSTPVSSTEAIATNSLFPKSSSVFVQSITTNHRTTNVQSLAATQFSDVTAAIAADSTKAVITETARFIITTSADASITSPGTKYEMIAAPSSNPPVSTSVNFSPNGFETKMGEESNPTTSSPSIFSEHAFAPTAPPLISTSDHHEVDISGSFSTSVVELHQPMSMTSGQETSAARTTTLAAAVNVEIATTRASTTLTAMPSTTVTTNVVLPRSTIKSGENSQGNQG